jgi:hypothetical protein
MYGTVPLPACLPAPVDDSPEPQQLWRCSPSGYIREGGRGGCPSAGTVSIFNSFVLPLLYMCFYHKVARQMNGLDIYSHSRRAWCVCLAKKKLKKMCVCVCVKGHARFSVRVAKRGERMGATRCAAALPPPQSPPGKFVCSDNSDLQQKGGAAAPTFAGVHPAQVSSCARVKV